MSPDVIDYEPDDVEVARRRGALIIDVREPDEFNGELGHVPGARLVPLAKLVDACGPWETDDEIVLVCRSGGRSARAAQILAARGFTRVKNLAGGMLRWRAEQRPVG